LNVSVKSLNEEHFKQKRKLMLGGIMDDELNEKKLNEL